MLSKKKYQEMIDGLEGTVYDGRGRGIDVYRCDKCGGETCTKYVDFGVTPFVMKCSHCGGNAVHRETVAGVLNKTVHEWVRPPYEYYKRMSKGLREHIEQGGLVLRQELVGVVPHIYD